MKQKVSLALVLSMLTCTTQKDPTTPTDGTNPPTKKEEKVEHKAPTPECGTSPYSPKPKGDFKHNRSSLIAAAQKPAHAAIDGLFAQGAAAELRAKFAYGDISKDLEDEPIDAMIGTCAGWKSLGEFLTDDDGIITAKLTGEFASLPSGEYPIQYQVKGDASGAEAMLRIFPKGTHLVVFDIDGTMTTKDSEIFKDFEAEMLGPLSKGDYVPEAYPGGPELTKIHEGRGAKLLYMTGRPYWLTKLTKEWLQKLGYAPATVKLTNSTKEALPTQSGVGAYKLSILKDLIAQGFVIDLAYGNAATDIYAYLGAGIDAKNVYIIGKHAGEQGTNALKDTWAPEVERAKTLPKIVQP